MNTNWHKNLTKYWFKIEIETKQILRLVKDDYQRSGMSFDTKFKDYFVRTTNSRITQTFDQFLSDSEFEEQFIDVRRDSAPAMENPIINKTIAEANGETDIMNNQPMADSILNGVYAPSNETLQRFVSYVVKNTDPNNLTSSAEAMFGNVSTVVSQTDQPRVTQANRSDPNEEVNRNYSTQNENCMGPPVTNNSFPNQLTANRLTIDPIAPASITQVNTTANWPQGLPTSTPFHGLVEQSQPNAPVYGSFQQIESFFDKNIDPNDVTSTIDAMLGNVSMLTAQIDQSQAIDAIETVPNENMMPHDAPGLKFSVLTDINSMNAPENEPIDVELPNDTIFGDSIVIKEEILVEEQAALSARINELINQTTECIDLTCEDVEPHSDSISNQIKRNVVREEGNQRRKRKMADATTSNESSKKRRKMGLRSALRTIPESTSEVALINQTLNEIESSEQANSTSSQPVQEESAGSSNAEKQSASTSKAKQVAKKKTGAGKQAAESGSKKHKCNSCEYSTSNKWNLTVHTRIHTGEKPFKCEKCAKGFTTKDHLKTHMLTHAKEFPFHCSICRQGFTLKKDKEMHEKGCNTRRYECYLCKKYSIFNKSHLVTHMRTHSGKLPFKCENCAKGFTRKSDLKRHMRTHAKEFPFHCSICRQGFTMKKDKEAHEKSCDPRRYECYLCKKYFGFSKSNLVYHMLSHTGEKPFPCTHCSKRFKQKYGLNYHLENQHKKTK